MFRLQPPLAWRFPGVLSACLLSACISQPQPVVRPIVTDVPAVAESPASPAHLPDPVLEIDPGLSAVPVRQPRTATQPAATVAPLSVPAAVSAAPVAVPAVTSPPAGSPAPAAPAKPRISTGSHEVPRIDCRTQLSKEDDLVRGAIEQRVQEGSYHAALAQIQSLPARVASVAILRADILRRLGAEEAEDWYKALQNTCVGAQAEHGLGLLAAERQDYTAARRYLMRAVEQQPALAGVRNDLGFVYLFLGQDRQAEFELRTAYELSPGDRQPALNLALLSLLRGNVPVWWQWRERLAPTQTERNALARSCQVLSQRWADMRARAAGSTSVATACPINPAL